MFNKEGFRKILKKHDKVWKGRQKDAGDRGGRGIGDKSVFKNPDKVWKGRQRGRGTSPGLCTSTAFVQCWAPILPCSWLVSQDGVCVWVCATHTVRCVVVAAHRSKVF